MDVIIASLPAILDGFRATLLLFALAAIGAFVIGLTAATMSVSPLPPLRWAVDAYVHLIRNSPLTVLFFMVAFGLPELGIKLPYFTFALIALTVYTGTFVTEVLRSGIQAVPIGQVEAARSLGMPFVAVLSRIVLPQAGRSVVPPMTSVLIGLFKNTSIASAFGVPEAIGRMTTLVNANSGAVLLIMGVVTAIYIGLGYTMGALAGLVERRVEIKR